MKIKIGISLAILLVTFGSRAQDEEHHLPHHDHHRNEIGLALAPVYFVKEKELSFGLHMHYLYNFVHTKFGLGLGYERIFDEHKLNTVGIVGSYRPFNGYSINVSPGITFEDNSPLAFALHIETAYEFELGEFHLGPVAEFAYDHEDIHLSIGLHLGYGF